MQPIESSAPDSGETIGPIDRHSLRPARTLVTIQTATLALLAVLTIVLGFVLAPRVAAGAGLIGKTTAIVTAVIESPDAASGHDPDDARCTVSAVDLRWGGGHSGTMTWCNSDADAHTLGTAPQVGDSVQVWALGTWAPVRAGSQLTETILALVMLIVLIATLGGSVVYFRHLWALRAVQNGELTVPRLTGRVDRLIVQRGVFKKEGRGRVRIEFDDHAALPLFMVVPGAVDRSLLGAVVEVRPLGRKIRGGRPCGPYMLRIAARGERRSGTLVAFGRPYREA